MDPLRPPASTVLIEALSLLRTDKGARRRGRMEPQDLGKAVSVREHLREIVATMEPDDPASYEAAQSRVLRCILASQWGDGHEADPLYGEVLAALERDVRENARLAEMFRAAMKSLQNQR